MVKHYSTRVNCEAASKVYNSSIDDKRYFDGSHYTIHSKVKNK